MKTVSILRRRAWLVLLLGLLATIAVPGGASADPDHFNALYTATNNPAGNSVIAFTRNSDGTLTQRETVSTGGTGIAAQPPFSFPIVDSSGSINVARDGHVLFVVNDGDNTISSFLVTGSGLKLVDHVSSGGILPVSLTSTDRLLYVVNEESSNIYGFRYLPSGQLTPLPGQAAGGRALSSAFPNTVAAQISFTPDGHQLVVTERGLPKPSGVIDTFQVGSDGLAGPAQGHTGVGSVDPNPFGFAFDNAGHLLVSNAGFIVAPGDGPPPIPQVFDPLEFNGTSSSYNLSSSGTLTHTSDVPSNGRAACWLVVSKDGKYAFVTNTLSDTVADIFTGKGGVTRYAVASDGTLSYLGQVDTSPGNPGDEAVSPDGKFLYVLTPTVFGPDTSHIDVYRIGAGGSLTRVASPDSLPATISGLGVS